MTNDPKKLLVIGVGSIGLRHTRCFQATGRVEVSICEINPQLRDQVAEEYEIRRTYADLDAALADPHDAAVIATPAQLHVAMATRLADAGVHLLIEKPLSTSLDGIDSLAQMIERRGIVAVVAYVLRANPILRAMKQAIDSGRFGEPVQLISKSGQNFPTYRPAYREIYYTDRATGGGAIQDALTHMINMGEWLVGPVDRLVADAAHQVLEGVEVEDTVHVLTRQGNVLGCYSQNQYQAPNEVQITVVCREGTVRFENHHSRWRWVTVPDEPWHDEPTEGLTRDSFFVAQANAFLDVLEGLAPPLCTLEEGLQTLRCNLAALASIEQGQWQTVRS